MMQELSKLREEQEQVRAAMGVADYADQQDNEEQQFKDGGVKQNTSAGNIGGMNQHLQSLMPTFGSYKTDLNAYNPVNNNQLIAASNNSTQPQYKTTGTSAWPSLISAGMSLVGDVAGMVNANKNMPKSVALARVAPYNINLQPQREALQRGYNTASNTILRNSRDVSNPANTYANQIAGVSGLMDSYGTQMGQSYMNEMNANAQMGQQRNMQNAEIGSREALQNAQLRQTNAQITGQYINSIAETIPSAMRDYRQQVNQDNLTNLMGKDYGLYSKVNPNENAWQAFVRQMFGDQKYVVNKNSPLIYNNR
jgi:hypothetical protein